MCLFVNLFAGLALQALTEPVPVYVVTDHGLPRRTGIASNTNCQLIYFKRKSLLTKFSENVQ
jgi:hypothetical protein